MQRRNIWMLKGKGEWEEWEIGIDTYTLLIPYTEEVMNENLLSRTGNAVFCADLNEKEIQQGGGMCMCVAGSLCCTIETNTIL